MELTDKQKADIERMGAINYSMKHVALYLGFNPDVVLREYQDEESDLRYHYERGQLMAQADIDTEIMKSAKDGNLTATQIYKKSEKQNRLNNLKHELFGIG
jgi:hypothetical protein